MFFLFFFVMQTLKKKYWFTKHCYFYSELRRSTINQNCKYVFVFEIRVVKGNGRAISSEPIPINCIRFIRILSNTKENVA